MSGPAVFGSGVRADLLRGRGAPIQSVIKHTAHHTDPAPPSVLSLSLRSNTDRQYLWPCVISLGVSSHQHTGLNSKHSQPGFAPCACVWLWEGVCVVASLCTVRYGRLNVTALRCTKVRVWNCSDVISSDLSFQLVYRFCSIKSNLLWTSVTSVSADTDSVVFEQCLIQKMSKELEYGWTWG